MTPLSPLPYLQPGDRALLFDGECNLCHGLVRYLIRADRQRCILLATVQSVEGQAILQALGLPTDRFDSVVYVEQGRYWLRSAALFQALRQLGWPYRVLALAQLGFDLAIYDLFGPLSVGGAVIYPEPARATDPSHWIECIESQQEIGRAHV